MTIDATLARYFLAVCDAGSINAAARRLYISQPALSRRIREFERRLGFAVFTRTYQGIRITPAGSRLIPAARDVVRRSTLSLTDLTRPSARSSTLHLGVTGGVLHLPPAVLVAVERRFREVHPGVDVGYVDVGFESQLRVLVDGEVDLLVTQPALTDDRLGGEPLFAERRVVVRHRRHRDAEEGVARAADVAASTILWSPGSPRGWMDPYILADVRPRRDAQLVATAAGNTVGLLADLASASAALVASERIRTLLGTGAAPFVVLTLGDVAPVVAVAHFVRHPVQRAEVRDYAALLAALCREDPSLLGCPTLPVHARAGSGHTASA